LTFAFVPIPTTPGDLLAWREHWFPWLADISRRSKEPVADLLRAVLSGYTQIALVFDGEKSHALIGMQYRKRGDELIGEIIWLTGKGMRDWQHLLPQMEKYLKDIGCSVIRPICRPGWSRLLKQRGYKVTHYTLEHKL